MLQQKKNVKLWLFFLGEAENIVNDPRMSWETERMYSFNNCIKLFFSLFDTSSTLTH